MNIYRYKFARRDKLNKNKCHFRMFKKHWKYEVHVIWK